MTFAVAATRTELHDGGQTSTQIPAFTLAAAGEKEARVKAEAIFDDAIRTDNVVLDICLVAI